MADKGFVHPLGGQNVETPGVRADRHHVIAGKVLRDGFGNAGCRGRPVGRILFQHGVRPPRVKQHHVTLTNRRALFFLHCADVLDAERLAASQMIDPEVRRHVQHDAPGHDGRDFLDSQLGQPGYVGKIPRMVAVVVHPFVARMTQAVQL